MSDTQKHDLPRLGLLISDYTHATIYATYLQRLGWEIAGISEESNVWKRDDLAALSSVFGGLKVYADIGKLLDDCDAFVLCNADYKRNLWFAEEVARRGKVLLVDKPACGIVRDAVKMRDLIAGGARILLGSSFIHSDTVMALGRSIRERGCESVHVYGAMEFFEHGIHAAEIAGYLMESRPVSAEAARMEDCVLVQIRYETGASAKLFLEGPGYLFSVVVAGPDGWTGSTVDTAWHADCHFARKARVFDALYRNQPVAEDPNRHIDAILALVAARESLAGGCEVRVADLGADAGFDSGIYAKVYSGKRRMGRLVDPSERERLLSPREGRGFSWQPRAIAKRSGKFALRIARGLKRRAVSAMNRLRPKS